MVAVKQPVYKYMLVETLVCRNTIFTYAKEILKLAGRMR